MKLQLRVVLFRFSLQIIRIG